MSPEPNGSQCRPRSLLLQLLKWSGAATALLITQEGELLTEAGDTSYLDTKALAALIAEMFTATRKVAHMVREKQFSLALQLGDTHRVHGSLVSDSTMMVLIFDEPQAVRRGRHEIRRLSDRSVPQRHNGEPDEGLKTKRRTNTAMVVPRGAGVPAEGARLRQRGEWLTGLG